MTIHTCSGGRHIMRQVRRICWPVSKAGTVPRRHPRQKNISAREDEVWQAAARMEDTSAAAPAVPPDHLYVSVDGAQAPIRDAQRPWQEVRVGVVFTSKAGKDGPGLDQREHVVVCAVCGVNATTSSRIAGVCAIAPFVSVVSTSAAAWSSQPASKWSHGASRSVVPAGTPPRVKPCSPFAAPIFPTKTPWPTLLELIGNFFAVRPSRRVD